MGIWGHQLPDETLAEYARADSGLSHPNPSCRDAVASYVIAIASLIREPGNAEQALERAEQWAQHNACDEVKDWLKEAALNVKTPYHPLDGFVRIGFTHAFRHLRLQTPYEDAIRETLEGGGDTDTNACIVGGLLGALWGPEAIPTWMKEPVLSCNTNQGQARPEFLHTTQLPQIFQQLFAASPTQ